MWIDLSCDASVDSLFSVCKGVFVVCLCCEIAAFQPLWRTPGAVRMPDSLHMGDSLYLHALGGPISSAFAHVGSCFDLLVLTLPM